MNAIEMTERQNEHFHGIYKTRDLTIEAAVRKRFEGDHTVALLCHKQKYLKGCRLRYDASGKQVWLDAGQVRAIERRKEGPKPPPPQPRHVLYRWYGSGVLLYVGISLSVFTRIAAHKGLSKWFDEADTMTIEHFSTRAEAEEAEQVAIQTERPLHNIQYAITD